MRSPKCISWIWVLAVCQFAFSQVQQQPVRDPQGISILTQVVGVSGGLSAIAGISDFTGSGTATYLANQSAQGSVTISGLGLKSFRFNVSVSGGERSWIVNEGAAWVKNPDGSTTRLPSQNAIKPAGTLFPLMQIVAALQDTMTNISYEGIVSHEGAQLHEISVRKSFPNDPAGALGRITQTHFYVDPHTMTVTALEDQAYGQRGTGEFKRELQFADYQSINGVLVPLGITEFISGQKTLSIQLQQMKFNTGLTSADFQ